MRVTVWLLLLLPSGRRAEQAHAACWMPGCWKNQAREAWVRLRDVAADDVGVYCDALRSVVMAELGGRCPRGMAAKVACDVQQAAADTAWIRMIIPGGSAPGVVARLGGAVVA